MRDNVTKGVLLLVAYPMLLTLGWMTYQEFFPDYVEQVVNTRTQELLTEPVELVISCTDTRGQVHVLACSVNSDVKGTWIIFEYVDGKVRGGTPSNFAFTDWEVRVGSNVSETIVLEFYPIGASEPVRTVYKMDTAYMREGVRNFAGVVA